jgi:hypothetical protein
MSVRSDKDFIWYRPRIKRGRKYNMRAYTMLAVDINNVIRNASLGASPC